MNIKTTYMVLVAALLNAAFALPRLAVYGSSVAHGQGGNTGYAAHLSSTLAVAGWNVVNLSVPGSNVGDLNRRFDSLLTPAGAQQVLVGLSLNNEGILRNNPERTRTDYQAGLTRLLDSIRTRAMQPVIGLTYPNGKYQTNHYEQLIETNIFIQSQGLPSINYLGTVDDGSGRWAQGFAADNGHPNDAGHYEMALAVVPTLFTAMLLKKPAPVFVNPLHPWSQTDPVTRGSIEIKPDYAIHSYSLTFDCRFDSDGPIAMVATNQGTVSIEARRGNIIYRSPFVATTLRAAKGAWHTITIAHNHAGAYTDFLVNGQGAQRCGERLAPFRFTLGSQTRTTYYRNLLLHRAALSRREIALLHNRELLPKASLEVYAPLDRYIPLVNIAQSLQRLEFGPVCAYNPFASAQITQSRGRFPGSGTTLILPGATGTLRWDGSQKRSFIIPVRPTPVFAPVLPDFGG